MTLAAGLGVGFCFGWLLEKAGLARYDRIVNVYRLRDLAVLKFLLSGLVVGAFGIRALVAFGAAVSVPVPSTFLVGNFGGGLLFGVGMALSGFCPGTIAAGVGEGRLDYLIPGSLGLFAGALAFGGVYRWLVPLVAHGAQVGLTLPNSLGVDTWLVIALLAEVALILFYALERHVASRR
ncbi:MAG TPA: YeeE/YedE thiosulfate transporter family protein [Polyangiaceae bacterium]